MKKDGGVVGEKPQIGLEAVGAGAERLLERSDGILGLSPRTAPMTENEEVIRHCLPLALLLAACTSAPRPVSPPAIADEYLDRYFATFPTRATMAGRHDHDAELERLDRAERDRWLAFNQTMRTRIASLQFASDDDRLDALLLARHIDREIFRLAVLRTPERNPLYWTEIIGNSLVFLLVRDRRIDAANARAAQIPQLVRNAEAALTDEPDIAPELCAIAAGQARASATFFRSGFAQIGDKRIAEEAAAATDSLAAFLADLQRRATGSPRLGTAYAENLRLATGIDDVGRTLAQAQEDLIAKKKEAAAYGRSVWTSVMTGDAPGDDTALLRALFARAAENHARTNDVWVAYGTRLVDEAEEFTRAHQVMTLPEPRTLQVGRSPAFFVGQSVGGVYPAGPYEPEANTLYYLPMPSDDATQAEREGFFRDFNDHFQRMITPHEIVPGHYVQLKFAARNPRKVRAMFPDDVYVEGWGTFCERLMLDLGWGGPLDRIAHLKKQMENIARTIVDIRVHTGGMTRDEVIRFVKEDALQDDQFARNMWTRSITSSPQLTYYYLGYRAVWGVYDEVRAARGASFALRDFTDALMRIGPVPPSELRRLLAAAP